MGSFYLNPGPQKNDNAGLSSSLYIANPPRYPIDCGRQLSSMIFSFQQTTLSLRHSAPTAYVSAEPVLATKSLDTKSRNALSDGVWSTRRQTFKIWISAATEIWADMHTIPMERLDFAFPRMRDSARNEVPTELGGSAIHVCLDGLKDPHPAAKIIQAM